MKNTSILFALILLLTSSSGTTRTYEWRGTGRTGIYNEKNLLKAWPAEGPKEIWSISEISETGLFPGIH